MKLNRKIAMRQEWVDAITPEIRPVEWTHSERPGFRLRIQPTGTKTFWYSYRAPDGRITRFRLGDARKITLQNAIRKYRRAAAIDDPQAQKIRERKEAHSAAQGTLGKYLDDVFEQWAQVNLKSAKSTVRRIRYHFDDLSGVPLTDLFGPVDSWKSRRIKAGLSPKTIKRDIDALSQLLARATKDGTIRSNPLSGYRIKIDKSRKARRALTLEEENRLLRELPTAPPHIRALVILALNTGIRPGREELLSLRWEYFDPRQRTIEVPGSIAKSGQTRIIPLNKLAMSALISYGRQNIGPMFPGPGGKPLTTIKTAWATLRKRAGISDPAVTFYSLRHTFGTKIVRATDLESARQLLGHADIRMTQEYLHSEDDDKRKAVDLLLKYPV